MMNKTYIGDDIDILVGILNLKQHWEGQDLFGSDVKAKRWVKVIVNRIILDGTKP